MSGYQQSGPPPVPYALNPVAVEVSSRNSQRPSDRRGLKNMIMAQREGLTPYLGLRSRLSQVWLNRWTILLLLVLLRVLIRMGDLNTDLAKAKTEALSACTKVEDIGSAMASMPHYLSVGVNSLIGKGITDAVQALVDVLMLILTGVKELILFVINWYIGTWVCLIAAFIHGGIDVAVAVVEGATSFINSEVGPVADELQTAVDDINADMTSVYNAWSSATSAIGSLESKVADKATSVVGDATSVAGDITSALGGIFGIRALLMRFAAPATVAPVPSLAATATTTATVTATVTSVLELMARETSPPPPSSVALVLPRATIMPRDIPQINIDSELDALRNFQINATQFVGTLIDLNTSIPTFAQAENLTEEAISIPFDWVKQALNDSFGSYTFNDSIFPVANKESLSFCSDNSTLNDFFKMLFKVLVYAKIGFIITLVILAILSCVAWAFFDAYRWHCTKSRARVLVKSGYDGVDIVYMSSRPVTSKIGMWIAGLFTKDREGHKYLLFRWMVAYATSLPALFVLSLAIAGLLSVACQAIAEAVLRKEVPVLAAEVANFAEEVVGKLENVSTQWANDANGVILGMQDDINDDILAYVVNATTAVNNTLNVIEDEINSVITDVFNGTVLYNTIVDVVGCLITNKIDKVEEGLTWVHDNAHVKFPQLPDDIFSEGANASISGDSSLSSFLASPSSVTSDDVTGAVDSVLDALHNGMIQELLISLALLMIYVIVVLAGVIYTFFNLAMPSDSLNPTARYADERVVEYGDAQAPGTPLTGDGRWSGEARFPEKQSFGDEKRGEKI